MKANRTVSLLGREYIRATIRLFNFRKEPSQGVDHEP